MAALLRVGQGEPSQGGRALPFLDGEALTVSKCRTVAMYVAAAWRATRCHDHQLAALACVVGPEGRSCSLALHAACDVCSLPSG